MSATPLHLLDGNPGSRREIESGIGSFCFDQLIIYEVPLEEIQKLEPILFPISQSCFSLQVPLFIPVADHLLNLSISPVKPFADILHPGLFSEDAVVSFRSDILKEKLSDITLFALQQGYLGSCLGSQNFGHFLVCPGSQGLPGNVSREGLWTSHLFREGCQHLAQNSMYGSVLGHCSC